MLPAKTLLLVFHLIRDDNFQNKRKQHNKKWRIYLHVALVLLVMIVPVWSPSTNTLDSKITIEIEQHLELTRDVTISYFHCTVIMALLFMITILLRYLNKIKKKNLSKSSLTLPSVYFISFLQMNDTQNASVGRWRESVSITAQKWTKRTILLSNFFSILWQMASSNKVRYSHRYHQYQYFNFTYHGYYQHHYRQNPYNCEINET